MSPRSAPLWALIGAVALLPPAMPAHGGETSGVESPGGAEPQEEEEGEEEEELEEVDEGLRQRLTEREDKRRPLKPWSTPVAGRPLVISGEYEVGLGYVKRRVLGEPVEETDRFLMAHGLELEAFYSFGAPLSLFAQIDVIWEEDLLSDTFEEVSDFYVERGEMWLYSENIRGSHINFDIGRLDFDEDRRWWWDDELDAVRLGYETETFEIVFALARELWPARSDRTYVEPENDRVLRLTGEVSWDWSPDHAAELFGLYQSDHSSTDRPGEVVRIEREDESDARLTWLGARLMGVFDLRSRGFLGYWLDTAFVHGSERLVDYEPISSSRSVAGDRSRRDVSGWAIDAGVSWILPFHWEPRLFGGYAFGSGDSTPDGKNDRSFRQTGLQSNEPGFGGVERFIGYGIVLDPELSNMGILTLGAGLSLLESSSLDLVYHHYRLDEPAESLRDSRLEFELNGRDRALGQALDVVLAVEEWERLEFQFVASVFRAGRAFGEQHGTWSYGGFAVMRIAF